MTYLLGYNERGDDLHYVAATRPTHGLCGTRLAFVPHQRPANPFVHTACQDRLAAALAAGEAVAMRAPFESGACPDCGGSVAVDADSRVAPHPKMIIRHGRMVASDEACSGAGEPPEEQP
ncbi:hypothetical protein [Micromonospora sp. NPDC047730]|uniref:hypothetical protein n=1 Tax=Micromonospora sp. NPDC047730 TaxID=3364253 RepID=UPI003721D8DF